MSTNIPTATVVCTVSVMFVRKENGEYATVLREEGVRPFEADIVLRQAARHIESHLSNVRKVREIRRHMATPLSLALRWLH